MKKVILTICVMLISVQCAFQEKNHGFTMRARNSEIIVKKPISELMEMLGAEDRAEWQKAAQALAKKRAETVSFIENALSDKRLCLRAIHTIRLMNTLSLTQKWNANGLKGGLHNHPNYENIFIKLRRCLLKEEELETKVHATLALAEIIPEEKIDLNVLIEGLKQGNNNLKIFILKEIYYILYNSLTDNYSIEFGKTSLSELGVMWTKGEPEGKLKKSSDDKIEWHKISLTKTGRRLEQAVADAFKKGNKEILKQGLLIYEKMMLYTSSGEIIRNLARTSEDEWIKNISGAILWKRYRENDYLIYYMKYNYLKDYGDINLAFLFNDIQKAIPYLSVLLHDKNNGVRRKAAYEFGRIYEETKNLPPPPYRAVKGLINILKENNNDSLKEAALYALGELGSYAKEAVPLLEKMQNEYPEIRNKIINTIGKIGYIPEKDILLFVNALENGNFWQKMGADVNLKEMKTKEEVALLIKLLNEDTRQGSRIAAFEALRNIDADAKDVLPILLRKFKEGDENTRICAARALAGIAPESKDIRQVLIKYFNEDYSIKVKLVIAWELGNIQPPVFEAVSSLAKALKSQNKWIRYEVAKALGKISDRSVLKYLEAAIKVEKSEKVKNELKNSINRIVHNH